jgi:hypothetical protein
MKRGGRADSGELIILFHVHDLSRGAAKSMQRECHYDAKSVNKSVVKQHLPMSSLFPQN